MVLDGSLTADTESTGDALAASGWVASTATPNAAAETVEANGVTYTADATLNAADSVTAVSGETVDITSNGQTFTVTFDGSGDITAITDNAGDAVALNEFGFDGSGNLVAGAAPATAVTTATGLFIESTPGGGDFTVALNDRTLAWDSTDSSGASTVTFTAAQLETEIGANDATFASVGGDAYFFEGTSGNVFAGADATGDQVRVSSADGSLTTDSESGGVDANGNGTYTLTNEAGATFSVTIENSTDPDGTGASLAAGSDTAFVHNGEVFADETIALNAATLADVEALDGAELQSAQYTIADGDFAGDYFVGA